MIDNMNTVLLLVLLALLANDLKISRTVRNLNRQTNNNCCIINTKYIPHKKGRGDQIQQ